MTDAPALAPCPFCHSTRVVVLTVVTPISLVQCGNCQAQGPVGHTRETAIAAWQARGAPWPHPCWWCQTVFMPSDHAQRYCHLACEVAAAEDTEVRAQARHEAILRAQAKHEHTVQQRIDRRVKRVLAQRQREQAYAQQQWEMAVS